MIELPLKFKKPILSFIKQYEKLASPRKIVLSLPVKVTVAWYSDNKINIYDEQITDISNHSKIIIENNKIKKFIKSTEVFGKKYFKNKDWLWETILWDFRPERGDNYPIDKIKWIKDYE